MTWQLSCCCRHATETGRMAKRIRTNLYGFCYTAASGLRQYSLRRLSTSSAPPKFSSWTWKILSSAAGSQVLDRLDDDKSWFRSQTLGVSVRVGSRVVEVEQG